MAEVRFNPAFRAAILSDVSTREWKAAAARAAVSAVAAAAPKETGFLTTRIEAVPKAGEPAIRVRAGVGDPPYGLFQEVGTGLWGPLRRWITPKRAQLLSWIDPASGRRIFRARVPGVKPRRYFLTGLSAVVGRSNVAYYGDSGGRPPRWG